MPRSPNTENMSRLRWPLPLLSIRATVAAAIVLGVVAPALVMLAFDTKVARRFNEPVVQNSHDALLQGTATSLAAQASALDVVSLRQTLEGALREPNVCGIGVSDWRNGLPPIAFEKCTPSEARALRTADVVHNGAQIGTLRVWFNNADIEQLVGARRQAVLQLVVAQLMFGALVLAGVLYLRLLRPIKRLKAQASAIAARTPAPALNWDRRDELGQLGQQLNEVRSRIDGLFDELERKNAQLRKMAMYDHLTGLPNRTLFRELFQHEVSAARRSGRSMAMLFIDLDRFKTINDSMGHAVGDEFLLGTSQRLLQALRESDLVCRHSGDEFLVLLRDADRWETVALAAERILRAVEAPLPLSRRHMAPGAEKLPQVKVSASLGIALYPRDGDEFDALVRHADLAMYESKQHGRARYSFYHAELNEQLITRVGLERELAHAITHDELVLHYQPVIDAVNGAPRGCEALVRWQHPTRGLLLPSTFIPMAEDCGLVRELGAWTLDAACAQIARWKAIGLGTGRVSVNVSALQFRDQRLIDTLRKAMQRHGVLADELELELTESALMSDDDTTQRVVTVLREIGVALVVDDFGTGYSSLSYLKRLRPDKLKIDRSFVQDLPGDADDCALTQAILSMARALGIAVVAEGVETIEQRNFLTGHGCAMLQGYLTGLPQPALELEAQLRAHDTGPASLAVSFQA